MCHCREMEELKQALAETEAAVKAVPAKTRTRNTSSQTAVAPVDDKVQPGGSLGCRQFIYLASFTRRS